MYRFVITWNKGCSRLLIWCPIGESCWLFEVTQSPGSSKKKRFVGRISRQQEGFWFNTVSSRVTINESMACLMPWIVSLKEVCQPVDSTNKNARVVERIFWNFLFQNWSVYRQYSVYIYIYIIMVNLKASPSVLSLSTLTLPGCTDVALLPGALGWPEMYLALV